MYNKDILSVTFGVRFNSSFKLLDSWGTIADDMLYNSGYFSSEFFPEIATQYTTKRYLSNSEKGHRFVLTSNNLVFTQVIEKDWDSEYKLFIERIEKYIIPNIISKYSLISSRIGIVFLTKLTKEEIGVFAKNYFRSEVTDICDFRFSRKEPTLEGSVFKETENFFNKIYTVGNINDMLGLSYDFQLHMLPAQADIRGTIKTFISSSESHFKKDVISCLEDNNAK